MSLKPFKVFHKTLSPTRRLSQNLPYMFQLNMTIDSKVNTVMLSLRSSSADIRKLLIKMFISTMSKKLISGVSPLLKRTRREVLIDSLHHNSETLNSTLSKRMLLN